VLVKVRVYLSTYLKYGVKNNTIIVNREACNKTDVYKVEFQSLNQLTGAKQEFRTTNSEHMDGMKSNIHILMYASYLLDCSRE
jgi:hypothetical protein